MRARDGPARRGHQSACGWPCARKRARKSWLWEPWELDNGAYRRGRATSLPGGLWLAAGPVHALRRLGWSGSSRLASNKATPSASRPLAFTTEVLHPRDDAAAYAEGGSASGKAPLGSHWRHMPFGQGGHNLTNPDESAT